MAHDTIAEVARAGSRGASSDWSIPLGLVALGLIPALGGLARLASFVDSRAEQADSARFASQPGVLAVHVVAGLAYSLLGALQFSPGLRRRHAGLHRAAGRLLAPAGLVAALSGVATMIVYPAAPTAGPVLHAMRIASAIAMVASLSLGLVALRRRDFGAHGAWMTRAYALGIAPGTQALALAPLAFVFGVDTEPSFTGGMAIGWMVNIGVAEWIVRGRKSEAKAVARSMRAIVFDRYGAPDELHHSRVPRPTAGPGQVLVRVEATSLNALDRRMLRADPFLVRLQNGLFRPRLRVLGADVAGHIEAIGPGVRDRVIGERVFGDCSNEGLGAFAEHVCLRASSVAAIPEGLDVLQAASLPLAAGTALQAVRERARLKPGQRVLVWGAGGGVGAYVVQIAKAYGAHVTAVAGPHSLDAVRGVGADRVLDHTRLGPLEPASFDVVFGVNGHRPLGAHLAMLVPGGVYVMVGGENAQIFEALLFGALRAKFAGRRCEVLTMDPALLPRDLEELRALVARGALRPVVDRVVPLGDVARALAAVERGEIRGKVVLDAREAHPVVEAERRSSRVAADTRRPRRGTCRA